MKLGAWLAGLLVVVGSTVAAADAPPRTIERSETEGGDPDGFAGGAGGSAPRGIDELRAQIAGILERAQVPGAGIALIDGDRILWAGGVGVADRATGRPVTADTLFRVGSITKSFVAMALVKLAEQGRVALDAPVAALAPELAIDWLPLPGSVVGKLHRLVFGLATCCATTYLAAYGVIGIRLWSY
ncbi:MAG TPA: serine hydrolase domain-containing protein [Kofleriaceae bacterium]|jgi:CubicO group peptidase (beta-lactamase class C family)|nr:serine hydrolase domain-containing protein [Kofleriaceae bacterium]